MNKLVLLSEVRKGKNELLEFNKVKSVQADGAELYIKFREKFNFFQNEDIFINFDDRKIKYTKYEKKLNAILKKVFLLDNKIMLIKFLNSIYNDDLNTSTRIEYSKSKDIINNEGIISKSSSYNISILAQDEYRKFEYEIKFIASDDENIAVMITKIDFINDNSNIISFNKKKKEHENSIKDLEKDLKGNNSYLIMLNSNIKVPDVYECKSNFHGKNIDYSINVIKSWKYDFKQLIDNEMYILFPVKVLDLRKRLVTISQDVISRDLIQDEIVRFFRDMNRYLIKVKDKNLITDKDIDEFNLVAINLLNHCIKEKDSTFIDIKTHVEAMLKNLVV